MVPSFEALQVTGGLACGSCVRLLALEEVPSQMVCQWPMVLASHIQRDEDLARRVLVPVCRPRQQLGLSTPVTSDKTRNASRYATPTPRPPTAKSQFAPFGIVTLRHLSKSAESPFFRIAFRYPGSVALHLALHPSPLPFTGIRRTGSETAKRFTTVSICIRRLARCSKAEPAKDANETRLRQAKSSRSTIGQLNGP